MWTVGPRNNKRDSLREREEPRSSAPRYIAGINTDFEVETFATGRTEDRLHYVGETNSLTHVAMKKLDVNEAGLVATFWLGEILWAGLVVLGFLAVG